MLNPCEKNPEDGHSELGTCGQLKHIAEQSQLDLELDFFEKILDQQPDFIDVLRVHGNNLTAKGLYVRGLEADRRLVRLKPRDPLAHYNLACSYSLLHLSDAALVSLDTSIKLGYLDFEHMLSDPDLEHVRGDARFVVLLGRYLKKTKQSRKAR
jgi:tetratricopeptide (TPR) repeat protein